MPIRQAMPAETWVVLWDVWGEHGGRGPPRDPTETFDTFLSRAERIAPRSRICAIVREQDEPWWRDAAGALMEENLLVEPVDRGTAPGVLLAVLRVFRRSPSANIVVWAPRSAAPSERRVSAVNAALRRRGRRIAQVRTVHGGCLVGSARAWIDLFAQAAPDLLRDLLEGLSDRIEEPGALDAVYPFLPFVDLEREVVGHRAQSMGDAAPASV